MKTFLLILASISLAHAQVDPLEGLWQGYDGEWTHVSKQLVALAEAFPAEKYAWRPGAGVRSTSEVFMHIALANFSLLSVTGPKMPAGVNAPEMEKTVTAKADVIGWLRQSLEAVKTARAVLKPGDLQRPVKIAGRDAVVGRRQIGCLTRAGRSPGPPRAGLPRAMPCRYPSS